MSDVARVSGWDVVMLCGWGSVVGGVLVCSLLVCSLLVCCVWLCSRRCEFGFFTLKPSLVQAAARKEAQRAKDA